MTEKITTYGIIGYPVKHSLSPAMHNAAFKSMNVDAVYKRFEIAPKDLKDFISSLKDTTSPIFGLNVTVPYKEEVLDMLAAVSPLAEKIGAVNTIVVSPERKLIGYNTDAPGFIAHLVELQQNTRDKSIAILGAGGSARAIISVLCIIPERPKKIYIYNRTPERLNTLIHNLSESLDLGIVQVAHSIDDLNIPECDLLINTTSVGLKEEDESLIDPDLLHQDLLVYDLIYNPAQTDLLKVAKQKQSRTANGLGMLYYQGVLALQHWANMELDEKIKMVMREALEKEAGL